MLWCEIDITLIQGHIKVHALNNVSIEIAEGEFTALVGPSGSGKTTLLNMIGGLDSPDSGQIILNNQNISELKKKEMTSFRQNNIGFVFQAYNLIPVLSAYENAEFVMLLQGVSKNERKHRVFKLLKEVGLEDRMINKPSELSGGQQQRVAVARAVVSNPELILADEPTGNLDSTNGGEVMDLLTQLNKEGTTIVMVTHSTIDAQRAHRIVQLMDGHLVVENVN